MKQSAVTVVGIVVVEAEKAQLKVSGSNEAVDLIPDGQGTAIANSLNGKSVLVGGFVPETTKGQAFSIHYHSVTEQP